MGDETATNKARLEVQDFLLEVLMADRFASMSEERGNQFLDYLTERFRSVPEYDQPPSHSANQAETSGTTGTVAMQFADKVRRRALNVRAQSHSD